SPGAFAWLGLLSKTNDGLGKSRPGELACYTLGTIEASSLEKTIRNLLSRRLQGYNKRRSSETGACAPVSLDLLLLTYNYLSAASTVSAMRRPISFVPTIFFPSSRKSTVLYPAVIAPSTAVSMAAASSFRLKE